MAKITVTQDNSVVQVTNGDKVYIDIDGGGTVTIQAAPGVNIKDIKIYFVNDTHADTVIFDLATFASYDLHIDINDYDPTDTVVLQNSFNQNIQTGNEDEFNFSYVGANGATFNGFIRAKDKGEKDFTDIPSPVIICFTETAEIVAEKGTVPIADLAPGDRVLTRDNGFQPLRWVGRRTLDSIELLRHPNLRPVRFAQGSLGGGLPTRDLVVSPQHRMLLKGWKAELLFGREEVLAPAIGFVNGRDITHETSIDRVTYYHLLFDRHEIVVANGVESESLHSGDMAMMSLQDDARVELNQVFPDAPALGQRETARPVAKPHEIKPLVA